MSAILQKFYVYDPGVRAGEEIGGLRVHAEKDGALYVLTVPAAAKWWIDQGLAGAEPLTALSEASRQLVAQVTRGRSENPDDDPPRVPRYSRAMQSGAPAYAASLASPGKRRQQGAKKSKRDKDPSREQAKQVQGKAGEETVAEPGKAPSKASAPAPDPKGSQTSWSTTTPQTS
jgi:hypothetical protein